VFDHGLVETFVHNQPARGGAALPGGPDRSEHNRAHGEIKTGAFIHDHGVIA